MVRETVEHWLQESLCVDPQCSCPKEDPPKVSLLHGGQTVRRGPRTEKPGELQSKELQEDGQD